MADTIREKIMDNIKTVLETITTGNGYENTIASVQRWRQTGNNLKNLPAVIVEEGPEDNEEDAFPLATCKLTVFLTLFIRQLESDSTDTGEKLNSLLGDIKKALKVDITRDSNAVDTSFKSITPFETDEGQTAAGLIIETFVLYRHQQTDPTVGL